MPVRMEREYGVMKRSTAVIIAVLAFFAGMSWGFMVSPIKKGIRISIGSDNTTYVKEKKKSGKKKKDDGIIPVPDMSVQGNKGKGRRKWTGRK